MKTNTSSDTPVYVKTDKDMAWPTDKFFYLLARDGLFICRNGPFFSSCVKAANGPGDLEGQKPFLESKFPLIPTILVEKAMGFFRHIYKKHSSESAVIFAWNTQTEEVEMIVPQQEASYASVNYEIPNLPPHLRLIGDMHSHCNFGAGSSMTDDEDEMHRPGVHIIAGCIQEEPPDFSCDIVVDGRRFQVTDILNVIEGYQRSINDVPKEWISQVKKKEYQSYGGFGSYNSKEFQESDEAVAKAVLDDFRKAFEIPSAEEVRKVLFRKTRSMTYTRCEQLAKELVLELTGEEIHYHGQQAT